MAAPPAIVLRGIVKRFGPQLIHDGVDLEVRRGEVMGLIGGSGSGKSVLLRSVIGLHRPNAGRVEVLGSDTAALDAAGRAALRERCGVLFQEGALFSSLTVAENIQAPLRERHRLPRHLLDELARLKLSLVGLPPAAGCRFPSELSGGMRKRAGLARAMALDPELLFLDEPTAGLDPIGAGELDELIRSLQASLGLTVLIVTHDLDSLMRVTDRIAALVDKKAVVGTLDELRRHPHPWLRDYFGGPRGRAAIAGAAAGVQPAGDAEMSGAAGSAVVGG
jgi:phospholipid/cholesterol/gamma-HCH transport system ATP-binding protein